MIALTPHGRAVLEVLQLPGVGQARGRELAREAFSQNRDVRELARYRLGSMTGNHFIQASHDADRIMADCERFAISIIALGDPVYPQRLAEIIDAPPLLYVKGDLAALTCTGVAVVGTREASRAGLKAAEIIGEYVVRRGLSVVSGLALGIDAAAHNGALKGQGITIAILAHGLDTLSPKANQPIATRLLAAGGALVSEHPPGVPARPPEFVRRNRIQSGMSLCSIVVESSEQGGAMHQAAFTVRQKRPLIAMLSRDETTDLNETGGRKLIREFHALTVRSTSELGQYLDQFLEKGGRKASASEQREFEW